MDKFWYALGLASYYILMHKKDAASDNLREAATFAKSKKNKKAVKDIALEFIAKFTDVSVYDSVMAEMNK